MNRIQRQYFKFETHIEAHKANDYATNEIRSHNWNIDTNIKLNVLEIEGDNLEHMEMLSKYLQRLKLRLLEVMIG
ncbi:MAG: hypothetical protein COA78_05715 [Blastopirellula sp.]|nr:MAG: hypothetical protein COA78_05715 [Blastopirellula sp.]